LPLGDALVEHLEQPGGVGVWVVRAELERRLARHAGQAGRQFPVHGHPRPVDQDGDDQDAAGQRRLQFQADVVARVVQALAGDRQPVVADEQDNYVARADRGGDRLGEVAP